MCEVDSGLPGNTVYYLLGLASNVASPQSFPSPPGGDKGAKEQEAPEKPQHPERGSGTSTWTCSQEGVGARPSSSQGQKVVAS